ncbi:MAG: hypothetical protein ACO225_15305, partial [Ilumatobacteraceae bacterium]
DEVVAADAVYDFTVFAYVELDEREQCFGVGDVAAASCEFDAPTTCVNGAECDTCDTSSGCASCDDVGQSCPLCPSATGCPTEWFGGPQLGKDLVEGRVCGAAEPEECDTYAYSVSNPTKDVTFVLQPYNATLVDVSTTSLTIDASDCLANSTNCSVSFEVCSVPDHKHEANAPYEVVWFTTSDEARFDGKLAYVNGTIVDDDDKNVTLSLSGSPLTWDVYQDDVCAPRCFTIDVDGFAYADRVDFDVAMTPENFGADTVLDMTCGGTETSLTNSDGASTVVYSFTTESEENCPEETIQCCLAADFQNGFTLPSPAPTIRATVGGAGWTTHPSAPVTVVEVIDSNPTTNAANCTAPGTTSLGLPTAQPELVNVTCPSGGPSSLKAELVEMDRNDTPFGWWLVEKAVPDQSLDLLRLSGDASDIVGTKVTLSLKNGVVCEDVVVLELAYGGAAVGAQTTPVCGGGSPTDCTCAQNDRVSFLVPAGSSSSRVFAAVTSKVVVTSCVGSQDPSCHLSTSADDPAIDVLDQATVHVPGLTSQVYDDYCSSSCESNAEWCDKTGNLNDTLVRLDIGAENFACEADKGDLLNATRTDASTTSACGDLGDGPGSFSAADALSFFRSTTFETKDKSGSACEVVREVDVSVTDVLGIVSGSPGPVSIDVECIPETPTVNVDVTCDHRNDDDTAWVNVTTLTVVRDLWDETGDLEPLRGTL